MGPELKNYGERKPFGLLKCEVKWNADGTVTEGLADRTAQKRQQTWESDNTIRRSSHGVEVHRMDSEMSRLVE